MGLRVAVLAGAILGLGSGVAETANIAVVPRKLIVVDRPFASTDARFIYVAKDVAVTKGSGTDPEQIGVRFVVAYADQSAVGGFSVPAGTANGWVKNTNTFAKYVNKQSPAGPTQARLAVIRPGKLKLVGKGLGDTPLEILRAGAPGGSVFAAYCIDNAGEENCHCSEFTRCRYKQIAGGAGAKLACKVGVGDARCSAAVRDRDGDGAVEVHVIGDSRAVVSVPPWPMHLQDILPELGGFPLGVINHAAGGGTACDPGIPWRWGQVQLDEALGQTGDVVIIEFGTNDLTIGRTPGEVVNCILALRDQAIAAGDTTYVALVTPHFPPSQRVVYNDDVAIINEALALIVPAARLIDFVTDVTASDTYDGLHPNQIGHAELAARVAARLEGWP